MKCFWLFAPMQLFIQGQWWSILTIHRLQMRQWCDRGGLYASHRPQIVSGIPDSDARIRGWACLGTAPGFVNMVFSWAIKAKQLKKM